MPSSRRRIVTGHNSEGKSVVISDNLFAPGDPNVMNPAEERDFCLTEIWRIAANPHVNDEDTVEGKPIIFGPPKGGITIKICELPAERKRNHSGRAKRYAALGASHGFEENLKRHPAMHTTETVDVIVVISGRMQLIMDEGEIMIGASDIIIQRGTNHAWTNPFDEPCVYAAILVDAAR
jgi:hypothetical protein